MRFDFSAEDEAFRREVREFIRAKLPAECATDIRRWTNPRLATAAKWQRILAAKGWGAPHWPARYGGSDWSPIRKHLFLSEIYAADAPDTFWQGLHFIAPVLIEFGSDAQRARYLPPMLRAEEIWCQGFSEPGAGSDLVSLKTSASLENGEWVINGQKIWTSDARECNWGFFLVRTAATPKPQRGLSMIMVKLDTPGLTIRPIRSIDGRCDLNEVFLDNVRVPADQMIGEPGLGWTYAKYLLARERTTSAFLYFNKRNLDKAKSLARDLRIDGQRLIDTSAYASKLARVEADLLALEWTVLRVLANDRFTHSIDAVVSALKVRGSQMQQRVSELQVEALGPLSLRYFERESQERDEATMPGWPELAMAGSSIYLHTRAATIYGGAVEIQKNIIAKAAFGF
jgi:alkylation response protein AidB-like acyl-CoA dehydrogenase